MTDISVISNGKPLTLINNQVAIQVGAQGAQGAPGRGIPTGGNTGQILAKASGANYDTVWINQGTMQSFNASENLVAGNFVNIFNNSGTTNVRKADNSNGRKAHGFVLASVTAPAAATVYFEGIVTGLSGLTSGAQEYLGIAGAATETAPSGTGVISQQIGTAISTTEILFEPQMTITLA